MFKGLTRRDPTLQFYRVISDSKSATVTGTLSGGGSYPLVNGERFLVWFTSPETSIMWMATRQGGPGYGPLQVSWAGPDATVGELQALRWSFPGPDNGPFAQPPTSYAGYGSRSLTLSNGGTFGGGVGDVALNSVAASSVAGTISLPPMYSVSDKRLKIAIRSSSTQLLGLDPSSAKSFSYMIPSGVSEARAFVEVYASGTFVASMTRAAVAAGGSGVTVEIGAAPTPIVPIDGATGVTTTTPFQWSPFVGARSSQGCRVPVDTFGEGPFASMR